MDKQIRRLVLIDGHAMLYRAWFAYPQNLTLRDGTIINAVYGFTRILLTAIQELKPTHLVVSFDVGKTFRHEMYEAYKAHREKMPEELKIQEPLTYRVVNTLAVPIFTKDRFEADDVIGTLAFQASGQVSITKHQDTNKNQLPNSKPQTKFQKPIETIIVTGDKDSLQLVDDSGQIRVYMPARQSKPATIYDEAGVKKDLGVTPQQIPDYKGLAGDSSDNIPGVRGVGPKTAVGLLGLFGSIEKMYQGIETGFKIYDLRFKNKIEQVLKPKLKERLVSDREMAIRSKELATIVTNVPIELDLKAAEVKAYDKQAVVGLFEEFGFQSLVNKLPTDEFEAEVQEALF